MLIKFLLFAVGFSAAVAEREHKVHNIILYPEKYSWCKTTPIRQVVASPGYEPVTIDNNVCVGACYSYSIPSTQPAEPGELLGPYCDSCQPTETKCYHVTLHADGKNVAGPKTFQKRVQIIMNCSCMSCGKLHHEDCDITDQNTLELPQDLFSNRTQDPINKMKTEEVPELLHYAPNKNPVPAHHLNISTNEQRPDLNSKVINLLKSIEAHKVNYTTLMEFLDFVNILNSEDMELDLSKLKDVVQKNQNILEKHRDFGIGLGQKNNANIERDFKKYHLPNNFGIEGVPLSSTLKHSDTVVKAAHHKHHLGDEVHVGSDVGHLVKGPHGSMVLAPNLQVEEKLNIDSDLLKPNHDGVVTAYENHNKNHKINDILTN